MAGLVKAPPRPRGHRSAANPKKQAWDRVVTTHGHQKIASDTVACRQFLGALPHHITKPQIGGLLTIEWTFLSSAASVGWLSWAKRIGETSYNGKFNDDNVEWLVVPTKGSQVDACRVRAHCKQNFAYDNV
jgi:hypothetical protein